MYKNAKNKKGGGRIPQQSSAALLLGWVPSLARELRYLGKKEGKIYV